VLMTDSTIVRWCQDGLIIIVIHQHWCSKEKGIRLMLDSLISVWNEIIFHILFCGNLWNNGW
jgi:hypothetical protein